MDKDQTDNILNDLRGNNAQRQGAIRQIVANKTLKGSILTYVQSHNGSQHEAQTVYNDAIVTLVKIVHTKRDMVLSTSLEAYIMGIAKNLWNNAIRKRNRAKTSDIEQVSEQVDQSITPVELLLQGDRADMLKAVLNQMKTKCKEVLMYWSGGYKMKEIAELIGYKSDTVARKKKSECMKELLQYLATHPHIKEQLSKV